MREDKIMSGTLLLEQRRAREKGKFGNLVVIKLCRRGCYVLRSTQKIQYLNGVGITFVQLVQLFSVISSL